MELCPAEEVFLPMAVLRVRELLDLRVERGKR